MRIILVYARPFASVSPPADADPTHTVNGRGAAKPGFANLADARLPRHRLRRCGEGWRDSQHAGIPRDAGVFLHRTAAYTRVAGKFRYAALNQRADALVAAIKARRSPTGVARQAHALADALLKAYPVASAPEHAPDLMRGATLYPVQCAACHGRSGHGDGPVGLALSPRPVDFTNSQRADQRSALSLYEVITQGVAGTPMTGYADRLRVAIAGRWPITSARWLMQKMRPPVRRCGGTTPPRRPASLI